MWHTLKLLSCLAAVATASSAPASDGAIFLFDAKQDVGLQGQGSIHEDAARLLLQQRMQSTQTTPSTALVEPIVQLLDNFGGYQYNLFQEADSRNQQKLLVVVEGLVNGSSATPQENPTAHLHVSQMSSDFIDRFIAESISETDGFYSSGWKHCEYEVTADQASSSEHPIFIGSPKSPMTGLFDGLPLSSLEAWSDTTGSKEILRLSFKEQADLSTATQLLTTLSKMFDYEERTIVLVSQPKSSNKHTTNNHYSVKSVPHVQSRRSQIDDIPSTLLPVCHSTNTSCTSATNSCSGHGSCYLKAGDCYACKCHKTTVRTADGSIRTVQWGGPACQKEDISTQFFLIGTITVLAILAVAGGISMLFSVGQEELPSVISAGVSSVRAPTR
ncbi:hypothetical protein UA08_07850 [Talaromyces atroroseus]|uniref:Vacuolar sorting protein Vps3844 C-terminal domain-containing protein n=1 Tax=Talaromyces atroroseus TaxID=1441469 RepID=A0A225ATU8_TALAT|nr:hypothetical protein UA08_07850 [Talaromyces atroroseus]OKL56897.1 hypothetical protein UA08_07850 [Talaromyces atroroseus]